MAGGLEVWRCAIIRGSTDCEIFPETSCQKNSKSLQSDGGPTQFE